MPSHLSSDHILLHCNDARGSRSTARFSTKSVYYNRHSLKQDSGNLDSSSHEPSSHSDRDIISDLLESGTNVPYGRVKSASFGHQSTIPPPTPPAIPPHLKDCEFYYNRDNTVIVDHVENSHMLNDDGQPIVRITVDGVSRICSPEAAKDFLQSLEPKKRGILEMKNRVYVGPVRWLVRVLIEEA